MSPVLSLSSPSPTLAHLTIPLGPSLSAPFRTAELSLSLPLSTFSPRLAHVSSFFLFHSLSSSNWLVPSSSGSRFRATQLVLLFNSSSSFRTLFLPSSSNTTCFYLLTLFPARFLARLISCIGFLSLLQASLSLSDVHEYSLSSVFRISRWFHELFRWNLTLAFLQRSTAKSWKTCTPLAFVRL